MERERELAGRDWLRPFIGTPRVAPPSAPVLAAFGAIAGSSGLVTCQQRTSTAVLRETVKRTTSGMSYAPDAETSREPTLSRGTRVYDLAPIQLARQTSWSTRMTRAVRTVAAIFVFQLLLTVRRSLHTTSSGSHCAPTALSAWQTDHLAYFRREGPRMAGRSRKGCTRNGGWRSVCKSVACGNLSYFLQLFPSTFLIIARTGGISPEHCVAAQTEAWLSPRTAPAVWPRTLDLDRNDFFAKTCTPRRHENFRTNYTRY
jgi:hypothetical protein